MNGIDLFYEYKRITFVCQRDGIDQGIIYTKNLIKIYTGTCKSYRAKYKRNTGMRFEYIRSAYSARYILRNILIPLSTEVII